MIASEPIWHCSLPVISHQGTTELHLLAAYVLGISMDTWFCRDRSNGDLVWERKMRDRPNTIKGLHEDVIVATEYRCDSPFSANYGIYGISLTTQKLLWTSHAPGRWGRFARLLDHIPDFTNDFRDDPKVVRDGQIWTQGGRILDAGTGRDIGRIEWTPELKMSVTEPTLNLKFEKYQECGEIGTIHTGIPGHPEKKSFVDARTPVQLYLQDSVGHTLWTFDASQIKEIGEPAYFGLSMRCIEPYIYFAVSDRPQSSTNRQGEEIIDTPSLFSLWTLDIRSGQITQKIALNKEPATHCRIVDGDATQLLVGYWEAGKDQMSLLCFQR